MSRRDRSKHRRAIANLPTEAELDRRSSARPTTGTARPTAADGHDVSGERIRARARAAEQLLAIKASSKEAFAALEERVRKRSLHKDWMYHGFDGAMALRSLLLLHAPNAVETSRVRPVARRSRPGASRRSALEEPARPGPISA